MAKNADGSLDDTLRIRYTCYGKLRKQTNCTGQTGYTVHILDEIIDKAVRQIFSKMRVSPKSRSLQNAMKKRMRNARIICKTFRHSGTRQKKTCWH